MSSDLVAVIDYGMGNLHSVASALEHVGAAHVVVTHDAELIRGADRVVFPGVGAIRDCMAEIRRLRCDRILHEALEERHRPVLAICIGLQALMTRSEENDGVDCLDVIPGTVRFFGRDLRDAEGTRLKVPHMGWNQVRQVRQHPLWHDIADDSRFYFVHSYYVHAEQRELVAGSTGYGVDIDAALARDNLFAVQFHPEKSDTAGLQLLRNFLAWNGSEDA
jgi:glutamine amidotransferase